MKGNSASCVKNQNALIPAVSPSPSWFRVSVEWLDALSPAQYQYSGWWRREVCVRSISIARRRKFYFRRFSDRLSGESPQLIMLPPVGRHRLHGPVRGTCLERSYKSVPLLLAGGVPSAVRYGSPHFIIGTITVLAILSSWTSSDSRIIRTSYPSASRRSFKIFAI